MSVMTLYHTHQPSLSGDEEEGVASTIQKELNVLRGVMEHILPHVGPQVLTLDLSHSKAATNELASAGNSF